MTVDLKRLRADLANESIPANVLEGDRQQGLASRLVVHLDGHVGDLQIITYEAGSTWIDGQAVLTDTIWTALRIIDRHLNRATESAS